MVCEYIDRNESVVSLRYTPKDGTILPITVCTEEDLQTARQTAAARHVLFGTAYCPECLIIIIVYIRKRAKQETSPAGEACGRSVSFIDPHLAAVRGLTG